MLTDGGKPSYTETVYPADDQSEEEPHIKFVLSGGEKCEATTATNEDRHYQMTYEITCDR